jgi:hypothetical protein
MEKAGLPQTKNRAAGIESVENSAITFEQVRVMLTSVQADKVHWHALDSSSYSTAFSISRRP